MTGLDLDAIANRWSTHGGMGNPRSADDYTDAGCRIYAEHGFRDVLTLVARVRELEDAIARVKDECHKTGEYNAHAKHLNIRSARLLAVEVLHILGGGS
ncbi:hypothetical protein [Gordonia sp. UCD-TK1]|uniref:hypothetical protein n=1 Tax=Gordonia sp. UCD-TK1 TaxID=1857893 RepID=UPI00080DDD05|nr:hypothetical protein [Gordonia sp. UCD-TK1]